MRRDRLEELGRRRQPHSGDLDEQPAGQPQAGGHVEGIVEVGIVDQPLPADSRPRLLEIDPHHDEQPVVHPLCQFQQPRGVVAGCVEVVDRTRADDGHETGILSRKDPFDRLPALYDCLGGSLIERQKCRQPGRRHQRLQAANTEV